MARLAVLRGLLGLLSRRNCEDTAGWDVSLVGEGKW